MICYKDKTFCVSPDCKCPSKITREDVVNALALKLPLAIAFLCNPPVDRDGDDDFIPRIPNHLLQGILVQTDRR